MSNSESRFLLCIKNVNCDDLEVRKIYEVLPDEDTAEDNYLRIIDDSSDDYLYPAEYFFPVDVSSELRETLSQAA